MCAFHAPTSDRVTSKRIFCYQVPRNTIGAKKKKTPTTLGLFSILLLRSSALCQANIRSMKGGGWVFVMISISERLSISRMSGGEKCADSGFQTAADVQIIKSFFFFLLLLLSLLPLSTAEGLCDGVKETPH